MNPVKMIYKKYFVHRYDDEGCKFFYCEKDFPGLTKEEFSFYSAQNNLLAGALYSYDGYNDDILVIFCHGIGEGHRQYTKEIEAICKSGFRVLTYDATGCGDSQGEDIRCLSQSLCDLEACIGYIKNNDDLKNKHLYVVGHSWGGYAAGNILSRTDSIEKAVIISGFVSVEKIIGQFFSGILKASVGGVMNYETEQNPDYVESSMVDALNGTAAKVLVIHSTDDKNAAFEIGAGYLQKNVTNPNVKYIITENKNHHPYYTQDAVEYLNEVFNDFNKACTMGKLKTVRQKKDHLKDVDWKRMTEHDDNIIGEILSFLSQPESGGSNV